MKAIRDRSCGPWARRALTILEYG